MNGKIRKITDRLGRFIWDYKFWLITLASVLVIAVATVLILDILLNPGTLSPEPSVSQTDPAEMLLEATDADAYIYIDEIVEFQVSDIDTQYLQTDIYTTIDNNVFMDALLYTGYNMEKHRADGKMWQFVPAADKASLGYLSKITYGGGSDGYETDDSGKPDIAYFERNYLVCATFVNYVYFNYLPNVAGIDTSALTAPSSRYSANSWYAALRDWVDKGYSEYIEFDYTVLGAIGSSFITFKPSREIPIGSLVVFCNPKTSMTEGSHVAVYAGYANGYDWLYHVGNQNGPEFCAVQRMNFGPNARWPIAIFTPPNNVRISPVLEIELLDRYGKPIAGSEFILKHPTSGKEISLGTTDDSGKIVRTDLSYGDFELVQILPEGYSCENTTNEIQITGVNNSYNTVRIINTKIKS